MKYNRISPFLGKFCDNAFHILFKGCFQCFYRLLPGIQLLVDRTQQRFQRLRRFLHCRLVLRHALFHVFHHLRLQLPGIGVQLFPHGADMRLQLRGADCRYTVAQIALTLFPDERHSWADEEPGLADCRLSSAAKLHTASVVITRGGVSSRGVSRVAADPDPRRDGAALASGFASGTAAMESNITAENSVIDDTLKLRDAYYPGAKVSVLSNATRLHIPEVAAALKRVDNPILKIDAPTDRLVGRINHPAPGYSLARVLEALRGFQGDFVLQTMFLRSPDFDSSSPEVLDGWMDIVRELKPRKVMVYTIDRPTPQEGLEKFSVAEMRALVQPLVEEGFNIDIKG